jgi:L-fuconolactonase
MRSLGRLDNVTAKVSGLVTEADPARWREHDLRPCVDLALDAFGPARLAFGSDWPVCQLAAGGYPRWWSTLRHLLDTLSRPERMAVYGGTTIDMYRLRIDPATR